MRINCKWPEHPSGKTIWAYIAGIFDGEGSINMEKTHRKYCTIQCSVKIVNTNEFLLNWLEKNVPFAFKIYDHHKSDPSRKNARMIVIRRTAAIKNFLEKVIPYLIVKRRQAELALKWAKKHVLYKRYEWRKRKSDGTWAKGQIIDRGWEERIYKQMRALNA